MVHRKGPKEVHLHDAELRSASVQIVDRLPHGLDAGAHEHDDALRVAPRRSSRTTGTDGRSARRTGPSPPARSTEPPRRRGWPFRVPGSTRPGSAPRRAPPADSGSSARARCANTSSSSIMAPTSSSDKDLDSADLVGRAEAVEEMEEWNARRERGVLRDEGEVVRFLHRARAEHSPTGHARGHDVGVIAEDRQRLRGDRARRHVEDRRRQLAGDLEHVRDHQQANLATP